MDHRAYRRAALLWGLLAVGLLAGCDQEAAGARILPAGQKVEGVAEPRS
jgi:hypothetical protein